MSRSAWQRKAPDAYWAQGDTSPAISEQLLDGNGDPVDLGGASVRFQATYSSRGPAPHDIDAGALIVGDATNGIVSYSPSGSDSDDPGDLLVLWQVTFAGGAVEHFPNSGYQKVRITTGLP